MRSLFGSVFFHFFFCSFKSWFCCHRFSQFDRSKWRLWSIWRSNNVTNSSMWSSNVFLLFSFSLSLSVLLSSYRAIQEVLRDYFFNGIFSVFFSFSLIYKRACFMATTEIIFFFFSNDKKATWNECSCWCNIIDVIRYWPMLTNYSVASIVSLRHVRKKWKEFWFHASKFLVLQST